MSSDNNDQKTVTQQVKDTANAAYEKIPSFQDVKDTVTGLFSTHSEEKKDEDHSSMFDGVNMDEFSKWFNENVAGEKDDKTKYEKLKNWFSEKKDKADNKLDKASEKTTENLDSFKKDVDELFDKNSASAEEKKDFQLVDWDALSAWYKENVKGEEPEKSKYEKVKEWIGLNKKKE